MSSQGLFEALNGKLNYPYFKGVRYGENGECVIEGRYSSYPVIFEGNIAMLTCVPDMEDNRKARATMLEAMAVRKYINKFFNPSLPFDAAKSFNTLKSAEKQRKTVSAVLSIAVVLIIGAVVLNHSSILNSREVNLVRNGTLQAFPDKTVGRAFDDALHNTKWESITASDGNTYVNVKGRAIYIGREVEVAVQFRVDYDAGAFEIHAFEIDGVPQGLLILWGLLDSLYE
jgi:hypothetical protein